MQHLDELQRWFLGALTAPAAAAAIGEHVLPNRQQSAIERLGVYQHAYTARLLEVLANLFPCTRFAVGEEIFARLAAGYIQVHPPSGYTLARLANGFPAYLDATRPSDWGAFVVELARLEQAIDRVFDASGPENLPPFSLPDAADAALKLHLVPGFELHRFAYPVSTYFTAWKAGREPAWPEPQEQFIALVRRDYIVRRYELAAAQYGILAAIRAGAPLGEAITVVTNQNDADANSLALQFQDWFRYWATERFFV